MNRTFLVLVVVSLWFVVSFHYRTNTVTTWSSEPGGAALQNDARILNSIRDLGFYLVFVALVLGYKLLHGQHHNDAAIRTDDDFQ